MNTLDMYKIAENEKIDILAMQQWHCIISSQEALQ